MKHITWWTLALATWMVASPPSAQEGPMTEEEIIELVRSDLEKDKVTIIGAAMNFSAEEAAKFWPIYKEYEAALAKVGDERLALIRDYASNFLSMTDDKAIELAQKALEIEGQRFELKRQCFEKLSAGVSPVTAARFLQVENQLNLLFDLQLTQEIPLIEKP